MPETQQASVNHPTTLVEGTIGSMKQGDVRFGQITGMWIDKYRKCWLNADHPVTAIQPRGLVLQIELRPDGYHVWPGGWISPLKRAQLSPAAHKLPVVQVHAK
jgi:hypothetical protein